MKIVLDAMGGDNAPQATCEGALLALRADKELTIILAGDPKQIAPYINNAEDVKERLIVLDAPEVITNNESPALAIRQKKDSAIVRGMLMVREGEADGFVSAGSTGAVLVGGMLRLGRIPGIERPALAPLLPGKKGHFLLIDCGANVDCKPEYLAQFGLMGDAFMEKTMGIARPRIGLVNNGAEEEKGNALYAEAHQLLKKEDINFVGNVEARYIPADQADVIVCDGFDGNIILKYTEGVAETLLGMIKQELMADTRSKIGALLAKPAFARVKKLMDYTEVGGAPLLGVRGAVVKAHGSSNAKAIFGAIRQASLMIRSKVPEAIEQKLVKQSV
ncbi:MAG TPA: phosphate acyltransferase PlsX [Clostridiales bacterium]|nr:phosphate acyltransferase PlsX [Clostridiales bacterium]